MSKEQETNYACEAYIFTREVRLFKDCWISIDELNRINSVGGLDNAGQYELIFEKEPPKSINFENVMDITVEMMPDINKLSMN